MTNIPTSKVFQSADRKNVYTCQFCGHKTVTVDLAEGVTPFIITCPNCKLGRAYSACYKAVTDQAPTHEWFKPAADDPVWTELDVPLRDLVRDHVKQGGLLLRDIASKRRC